MLPFARAVVARWPLGWSLCLILCNWLCDSVGCWFTDFKDDLPVSGLEQLEQSLSESKQWALSWGPWDQPKRKCLSRSPVFNATFFPLNFLLTLHKPHDTGIIGSAAICICITPGNSARVGKQRNSSSLTKAIFFIPPWQKGMQGRGWEKKKRTFCW